MTSPEVMSRAVKAAAADLGFDDCRVTTAAPVDDPAPYRRWLERRMNAGMAYMARDPGARGDPSALLPGARSIVVVALGCWTEPPAPSPDGAIFATYARNLDYHDIMRDRLRRLASLIGEAEPGSETRICVDSAPLLEREVARRAGIGWFGKNTMLVATRRGSHFLLGEVLTTARLAIDPPARGGCGTCTRCLRACPTGALVAPYVLDARRCISYLTIEHREAIPKEHAEQMGNHVFGCDICQEVCPFNARRARPTEDPALQPRAPTIDSTVTGLLALSDEDFRAAFRKSPVKRAKRRGLLRNAAASLSARDDPEAIASLERALHDPEPLVREQAARSLQAIAERERGINDG